MVLLDHILLVEIQLVLLEVRVVVLVLLEILVVLQHKKVETMVVEEVQVIEVTVPMKVLLVL